MAVEHTLGLIKPDAVSRGLIGRILSRYEQEGFKLIGLRLVHLTRAEAEAFYAVHRERPFFVGLTEYMSSGPIVAVALERENAVAHLRQVMGATDPREAEEGTLRAQYAESIERNSVHGSDALETARAELNFFFADSEWLG